MNRNEALQLVKAQITEKRYVHTLGVVETAIRACRALWSRCEKSGTCCNFS